MADMEDDKDVSRRYRELGRDEPPPALDARIRAEARSAVETHAAPLVPPTGRRRWYFPVAAAAVIMLAVGVALQVEREQPAEPVASAPEAAKKAAPAGQQPKVEEAKPQKQAMAESLAKRKLQSAPAAPARPAPAEGARPAEPRAFPEQPKDQAAPRAASGERSRDRFTRDNRERQEPRSAARADIASGALSAGGPPFQTPEAWLAHIQALREAGADEEADKQLEAFRKRYPDYKIPAETLKKVERKK